MGFHEQSCLVGSGVTVDQVNAVIASVGDFPDDSTWAEASHSGIPVAEFPVALHVFGAASKEYLDRIATALQHEYGVVVIDIDDVDDALRMVRAGS